MKTYIDGKNGKESKGKGRDKGRDKDNNLTYKRTNKTVIKRAELVDNYNQRKRKYSQQGYRQSRILYMQEQKFYNSIKLEDITRKNTIHKEILTKIDVEFDSVFIKVINPTGSVISTQHGQNK